MRGLIAFLLLGAVSNAQGIRFLPFLSETCGPCVRFNADYANPHSGLRSWLKRHVVTGRAIMVDQRAEAARHYKVRSVPTFLYLDEHGNEICRTVGYTTPVQLKRNVLEALKIAANARPAPQPEPDAEPAEDLTELFELRDQVRELQRENQDLQRRDYEARSGSGNRLKQIDDKLEAVAERLAQEPERASGEPVESVMEIAPKNAQPFPEASDDTHSNIAKWAKIGVAVAAPEFALPVSAALSVAGYFWRRRNRSKTTSATPSQIIVDAPAPEPQRQIESHFVNVESDRYQQAHERARQHIARKYPGSQEILEAELSLTRQFLSGQPH